MLRTVRIRTMVARTATFSNVGATTTVRMMSPATRNSRPSTIALPKDCRNCLTSITCVFEELKASRAEAIRTPAAITTTPAASNARPTHPMISRKVFTSVCVLRSIGEVRVACSQTSLIGQSGSEKRNHFYFVPCIRTTHELRRPSAICSRLHPAPSRTRQLRRSVSATTRPCTGQTRA